MIIKRFLSGTLTLLFEILLNAFFTRESCYFPAGVIGNDPAKVFAIISASVFICSEVAVFTTDFLCLVEEVSINKCIKAQFLQTRLLISEEVTVS